MNELSKLYILPGVSLTVFSIRLFNMVPDEGK